MKKPELLAPAGSWEAMVAAVQNGADAVYLGGSLFSARASAANFDNDTLKEAVKYCHIRGVKIHVALNILIKQCELEAAFEYAKFLYSIGVDALIIQDLGLVSLIRTAMPEFELHASTQMSIHNADGVLAMQRLGFKRVVLARELSYKQIAEIKAKTDIELEIFAHGALCHSVSGQCLFSSVLGGRSGNRGRCAQPCRLPYSLTSDNRQLNKGHLLSPKDMCIADSLDKVIDLGVDSLKIEGRLKRSEYVATVTSVYRKYIDSAEKVSEQDYNILLDAFNRSGFTDGYFADKLGKTMMCYNNPSNIGGEHFPKGIEQTCAENANLRKIDIYGSCAIKTGEPVSLTLWDNDEHCVTVNGDVPEKAINRAIDSERVSEQLKKLGSTPFELKELSIDIDDGLSLPISAINALRRSATVLLESERCKIEQRETASIKFADKRFKRADKLDFTVEVRTLKQAKTALKYNFKRIYVPQEIYSEVKAVAGNVEAVLKLPAWIPEKYFADADCIETGIFGTGTAYAKHKTVYGGFRLNVYNRETVKFYTENGFETVVLSPELNLKEISQVACENTEVMIYGRMELMLMRNCVINAAGGKCGYGKSFNLHDRKNEDFPVLCCGKGKFEHNCHNILLNSKPTYLAERLDEVLDAGVSLARLCFTVESAAKCDNIIKAYMGYYDDCSAESILGKGNFTRGHFFRGVE